MKYRTKPTIIEASQYLESSSIIPRGVCRQPCLDGDWRKPHVHTAHNNQSVILEDGDWILPEPDGIHFCPCKPEIFVSTYEAVEQNTRTMNESERKHQLAGLRYALDIVKGRRILNRKPEYLAALDEIEIFLQAAIERVEHGEPMHSTAVVESS